MGQLCRFAVEGGEAVAVAEDVRDVAFAWALVETAVERFMVKGLTSGAVRG